MKTVRIVGMGALGILFGDFLTKALGKEQVSFVADNNRIEKYRKRKITDNGDLCDFSYVDANEKGTPADLLIFAVKATALESALETTANQVGEHTIILSLLNGISSEEIIAGRFGWEHMLYCVAQGMDAVKEESADVTALTYSKMGELCIGLPEADKERMPLLDAVFDLFTEIKMPFTREQDIMHRLWSKFMLNVGINQVTMIFEGGYGVVQKPGKERDMMQAAMREVILLAGLEHVNVTEEDLEYYVNLTDQLSPTGMPSMRQDGKAHRKTEVELFAGTVCRLAEKHNVKVPVNEMIYKRVKEMEQSYI
ncbi:MAG: ketopantoate reductase family protein [Lachnospiraceae bacterium]|nr:ketopantoate reductase family protein [Lachnospiraceae bacterium]